MYNISSYYILDDQMKKKTDLTSLKQVQKDKLTTSSVVPVISSYLTTAEKNPRSPM